MGISLLFLRNSHRISERKERKMSSNTYFLTSALVWAYLFFFLATSGFSLVPWPWDKPAHRAFKDGPILTLVASLVLFFGLPYMSRFLVGF